MVKIVQMYDERKKKLQLLKIFTKDHHTTKKIILNPAACSKKVDNRMIYECMSFNQWKLICI